MKKNNYEMKFYYTRSENESTRANEKRYIRK